MQLSLASFFTFDINFFKGGIQIGRLNIQPEVIYNIGIKGVRIVLIVLLMVMAIKVGSKLIDHFIEKQDKLRFSLDSRKSKTLGAILKSILRYAVYFFGIIQLLDSFKFFSGINLTFAGIGGVALGFGAQSLIKDIINGFFILFEDQFAVGDYINIDDKGGIVESIELRVTKIRDFNGDLHIVPNGMISKVTNHSRGDMRILVDVDIAYEEDVDRAVKVIQKVCEDFKAGNENVVEGPNVVGVTALKDNGYTIRIVGKVKSMTQWENEVKLRREIKKAFEEAKIEIPYLRRKIIKEE